MARKAFSIHSDYYEELRSLSSERRGNLLLALVSWASDDEPPQLDAESAILFRLMSAQIERISRVNSKNGAQGGAPFGNQNAGKSTETSETSESSQNKPSVSVSVPVSDTDSVSDADTTTDTPASGGASSPSAQERRFNEFWTAFPQKVAKKTARKAWDKLHPDETLHRSIMAGVEKAKHSDKWRRENGRYIPNPTTWLNGGCWEDELTEAGGYEHGKHSTDDGQGSQSAKPRGFNPNGFKGFHVVGDADPGGDSTG